MFTKNEKHIQPTLFSKEQALSDKMKKRLDNSWADSFYKEIFSQIDETIFAPIFCKDNGRPNFPVNILVGLEILKGLHNLTDEVLYDRYLFDMLYHHALGIDDIEENEFTLRTLYNFRKSLSEYDEEHNTSLMMEVFKDRRDDLIEKLSIKIGLQRSDTVMINANIKRMNRIMLFHKVLANYVKLLVKKGFKIDQSVLNLVDKNENHIAYRTTNDKIHETTTFIGITIFKLTEKHKEYNEIVNTEQHKNAIRLINEQCDIIKEKKRKRVALKDPKNIKSSSMQNPSDNTATYRTKNGDVYRGYVTFAAETCDPENKVQVVTSIDTYKNNVDDTKIAVEKFPEIKEDVGLDTMITDGGFPSKDLSEKSEDSFEVIATAIRGRKSKKNKTIGINKFNFDNLGLISSCPGGNRPIKQNLTGEGKLTASFDKRNCNNCSLKEDCIAYISETSCRIKIDSNRRWLNQRALSKEDEEYIRKCKMRPAVEGLMDKVKPKARYGRINVRGIYRVKNRMILKAIGINFRRYYSTIPDFLYFLKKSLKLYGFNFYYSVL